MSATYFGVVDPSVTLPSQLASSHTALTYGLSADAAATVKVRAYLDPGDTPYVYHTTAEEAGAWRSHTVRLVGASWDVVIESAGAVVDFIARASDTTVAEAAPAEEESSTITADVIQEANPGAGVTADGVLLKDSTVTASSGVIAPSVGAFAGDLSLTSVSGNVLLRANGTTVATVSSGGLAVTGSVYASLGATVSGTFTYPADFALFYRTTDLVVTPLTVTVPTYDVTAGDTLTTLSVDHSSGTVVTNISAGTRYVLASYSSVLNVSNIYLETYLDVDGVKYALQRCQTLGGTGDAGAAVIALAPGGTIRVVVYVGAAASLQGISNPSFGVKVLG